MNQWITWCWGTQVSPPLQCDCPPPGCNVYATRRHRAYGLLVGRVLVGVVVSQVL